MNLGAVMAEVAQAMTEITGLNVTGHPIESVSPPAAGVTYPEKVIFGLTYGRGMTKIQNLPVVVVLGRVTEQATRDKMGQYADTTGERSVFARLEARDWASCDTLIVVDADFDSVRYGQIDYLQATFYLDITGN